MILSDVDLRKAIESGDLALDPFRPSCVQPASLDLTLGNEFAWWAASSSPEYSQTMDLSKKFQGDGMMRQTTTWFTLEPGMFALAHTLERVRLSPGLMARVEGRSTLGRLGLMVHATAGYIDPGWDGQITLELFNLSPHRMTLQAGQDICQLAVGLLLTPAQRPYGSPGLGSKYQGQSGVQPARWGASGS